MIHREECPMHRKRHEDTTLAGWGGVVSLASSVFFSSPIQPHYKFLNSCGMQDKLLETDNSINNVSYQNQNYGTPERIRP